MAHFAPNGRFLLVNQNFWKVLGYTSEEMLEKTFYDITYHDDLEIDLKNAPSDKSPRAKVDEIVASINETGMWQGEVNNTKKDGTPFWCYASVSVFSHVNYGKVIVAVHSDITERKKFELALIESDSYLKRAQAVAHIGMWQLDLIKNKLI